MKLIKGILPISVVIFVVLLSATITTQAQVPCGWEKITGNRTDYSGVPDGISGDRENSYAWAMDIMDGYLYVGVVRDVFGEILVQFGIPPNKWPSAVPIPTDLRAQIYRMNLHTQEWDFVYESEPFPPTNGVITGPDLGYRMMKTFKAHKSRPVLYVGGAGFGNCRLLAFDCKHDEPVTIFQTQAEGLASIRAIIEHYGYLFWAGDEGNKPAIWYSYNPLKQVESDPDVKFKKITVPDKWFPKGAEIFDMVSYNGYIYVFFTPHDPDNLGFWCAKARNIGPSKWRWTLIVGDKKFGAKYSPGAGRESNAGASPFVFKDRVYVGTLNSIAFLALNQVEITPERLKKLFPGSQMFRFNQKDQWERVMPVGCADDPIKEALLSGFGNPFALYVWRFGEQNGRLYAGMFDSQTAISIFNPFPDLMKKIPDNYFRNPLGFDMYSSTNGTKWRRESVDGFADQWNYGARTFVTDPENEDLYMGTANPFYGCQIWGRPGYLR